MRYWVGPGASRRLRFYGVAVQSASLASLTRTELDGCEGETRTTRDGSWYHTSSTLALLTLTHVVTQGKKRPGMACIHNNLRR